MGLKRNVLLFHLGALGDFLLTWPLAMALARLHPQSRIIYITHPRKGALAERLLRIESASIEDGWHHLYGDPAALPERPGKLLASAHSIYSFIAGPSDPWAGNIQRLAPDADLCCLNPRPPETYGSHATDFLLSQLELRKALAEAIRQMLHSLATRGLMHARQPSKVIAIHPGSGSAAKCWPAERFLTLIDLLTAQSRPTRVLLGETELERWPAAVIGRFESAAQVVRPSSCLDLLASLSDACAFIGNDSGPGHLAAMLGIPTYSLFGPSNPAIWRPLGPHVTILPHSLSPEEVSNAIQ